jgi:hypothetical protein
MFKKFDVISHNNKQSMQPIMSVKITDDDFTCIINSHHIADAVVKIYEKKS